MKLAVDAAMIAADIQLIHARADPRGGKIVLATFGEDPVSGRKLQPKIEAFDVGDHARMTERALQLASEEHRNVYAAQATMRSDLQSGKKGGEADIQSVFGLVADFDARDDPDAYRWLERLPVPATMVVETSSLPEPSFQCRIYFSEPVAQARAKQLARALQARSGCDTCSVDLSHVWRICGTLNWPNRCKVADHGRPLDPQPVKVLRPFDPAKMISADELATALGLDAGPVAKEAPAGEPSEARPHSEPFLSVDLDALGLPANIRKIVEQGRDPDRPKRQDNSRSAWLFHALCGMVREKVPDEIILSIITDPQFKISESVRDKGSRAAAYASRQIERAKAESGDTFLEAFNREHAVVENYGNRTVVITFDSKGGVSHRSFEDFKRSKDHRKVMTMRNGKVVPIGEGSAFLDNPNRRQFKAVTFLPGKEADDGVLNLYRGPSIQPKAGDCSSFLDFVSTIICDGDEEICEWLLNSIAHLFRRPWETPEVCVVLRGRQGVGKNVFVEWIGEIIGDYFIVISNPKHLVGGFNRHLMDKLVVFADEAFYGNEKRYAGILKNLVTQSQMAVEPKGVDVFMAKKYFRLFMASNEDFVVPADLDDRRMLVIDVSDARAKDHAYFEALKREWDDGGREAFYDQMLKRDISAFNHRKRPETAALVEQKIDSLVGAERIVFEMLSSGQAPFPRQQVGANFVATESLIEEYGRRGNRASARSLADELAIIALHDESKRQTVYARQVRGFWLPSLAECRMTWARAKKLNIEWGADDGEWINSTTPESLFI